MPDRSAERAEEFAGLQRRADSAAGCIALGARQVHRVVEVVIGRTDDRRPAKMEVRQELLGPPVPGGIRQAHPIAPPRLRQHRRRTARPI